MKVMIVNNSGNVGKSFVAREVFYHNMNCDDKKILEIETHNSSSKRFDELKDDVIQIGGQEIGELNKHLIFDDCLIVDTGASNVTDLLRELEKNDKEGILGEIDLFVVPVPPKEKQQKDSFKIVSILADVVPAEKIKVIYNMADRLEDYADFDRAIKKLGLEPNHELQILDYETINQIESLGVTVARLAASEEDYRTAAKEAFKAGKKEEAEELAELALLKGSAGTIRENLRRVYEQIVGG